MTPSDFLVDTTVRIESIKANGEISVGTGFFYGIVLSSEHIGEFVITNKHVIKDAVEIRLLLNVTPLSQQDRYPETAKIFSYINVKEGDTYINHPQDDVDLCAIKFGGMVELVYSNNFRINRSVVYSPIIATNETYNDLLPIEDIIMVGYPNGIYDFVNNRPVLRRGITSSRISENFNGKNEFLIDCACFPGSSGSPVFLYNNGSYTDKYGATNMGIQRLILLGILYAGPQISVDGQLRVMPIPTSSQTVVSTTNIMMNLGYCIKAVELESFNTIIREEYAKEQQSGRGQ